MVSDIISLSSNWFVSLLYVLNLSFYGLHATSIRFQTFSHPCMTYKCLHCPILCNIHCNILLNKALVPYLYLNTYTFCCRSKIKGMICRWPWIWLLMNIKLQAPENLFASLLMKPSRNMVKMWRFYAPSFYRLQRQNKCPGP
ncbi:hypothetical protein EDC04DRAFT_1044621 [Pisolithus marmoratus]|nr:hypothetical protein EDC04DRAFT_1044621 [Pisolithus marmoratus]